MKKKVWAWDLETLDYFTAYFIDANDNEEKCFILGDGNNQIPELIKFLSSEVRGLIGFNSLNFDAQIIEYVMDNPNCSAKDIKNLADTIIKRKDEYESIPEWKLRHKHLDLYKVHHFDNKNRRTGLKWCQFMMDMPNIEDLSEEYDSVDQIISYNRNDVASTKELYERSRGMVNLRNNLTKLYSINFTNSSNSRIGSELLLKLYCNRAKLNPKEVRKLRTYRNGGIYLNDIIFPYISFENEIFNTFLKMLKTKIIYNTKGDFKYTIPFKGVKFEYGAGGIHASINGSLIEEDEEYMIIDSDVTSLYPSIAIENKMYPKHLGPIFTTVYKEDIVDVRKENKRLKEKGNSFIVDGFKEAANATYGLREIN